MELCVSFSKRVIREFEEALKWILSQYLKVSNQFLISLRCWPNSRHNAEWRTHQGTPKSCRMKFVWERSSSTFIQTGQPCKICGSTLVSKILIADGIYWFPLMSKQTGQRNRPPLRVQNTTCAHREKSMYWVVFYLFMEIWCEFHTWKRPWWKNINCSVGLLNRVGIVYITLHFTQQYSAENGQQLLPIMQYSVTFQASFTSATSQ